jgi:mRNA interferase MazF
MREGAVVLLALRQADGQVKPRPAVVLRQLPGFGDWLVCGVSSQLHQFVDGFDEQVSATGGSWPIFHGI